MRKSEFKASPTHYIENEGLASARCEFTQTEPVFQDEPGCPELVVAGFQRETPSRDALLELFKVLWIIRVFPVRAEVT